MGFLHCVEYKALNLVALTESYTLILSCWLHMNPCIMKWIWVKTNKIKIKIDKMAKHVLLMKLLFKEKKLVSEWFQFNRTIIKFKKRTYLHNYVSFILFMANLIWKLVYFWEMMRNIAIFQHSTFIFQKKVVDCFLWSKNHPHHKLTTTTIIDTYMCV